MHHTPDRPRQGRGFTLIELLIVIMIIGLLVSILIPSLGHVQSYARKVKCQTNLKAIGYGINMFTQDKNGVMPEARNMPAPFVSGLPDPQPPALHEIVGPYMEAGDGDKQPAFECPGDHGYVYDLCGSSYQYMPEVSGEVIEDSFLVQFFHVPVSEIVVMRDFDGGTFDTDTGSVHVPRFHALRNLLFADGHAGNF